MKSNQIGAEQLEEILNATETNRTKALTYYVKRLSLALNLYSVISAAGESRDKSGLVFDAYDVDQEAAKHMIVSTVSAIEVYFKEIIVENADGWDVAGYDNLLTDKITLGEAYHLFKHENISREKIIAEHYSFQSIEQIASTMDSLTGGNFYDKVVKTTSEAIGREEVWDEKYQPGLRELFDLRNRIIHENNTSIEIPPKTMLKLWSTALLSS